MEAWIWEKIVVMSVLWLDTDSYLLQIQMLTFHFQKTQINPKERQPMLSKDWLQVMDRNKIIKLGAYSLGRCSFYVIQK